jgi:hypothetical protein
MSQEQYADWIASASSEHDAHYSTIMCLNVTTFGPNEPGEAECAHLTGAIKLAGRENLKCLCVLPKGHAGKCQHKFTSLFDQTAKKLLGTMDLKVYSVPGNDDYVYKNRSSRLYGNVLSNAEEKKIRDKQVKKKCAIPLKDATTPTHMSHAAMDWITFLLSVPGVSTMLKDPDLVAPYFDNHKQFLVAYYQQFHRKLFDDYGNTMCVVTRHTLRMEDVTDSDREAVRDTDLQMGHNVPRSDKYITIRGCNLLPMTRRGNLIIGERKFTENAWIEELFHIVKAYN